MNEKLTKFDPDWVDPDDAPELTKEWFETASYMIDEREVTKEVGLAALREQIKRGRPTGSTKEDAKQLTAVRFDRDVLVALRATGRGWQTRVNDMVRAQVLGNRRKAVAA